MDGAIFTIRCDGRTAAVEKIAERWKKDHRDAMFAMDVQDMIKEYLDHQTFLRKMWEDSVQRAVEGSLSDLNAVGNLLVDMFDRSIDAFEIGEKMIEQARKNDYAIDCEREFRRGIIETKKIRHRINTRWPFTDEEAMNDAIRSFREGRSRSVQDIIDDLRSRNPGTR